MINFVERFYHYNNLILAIEFLYANHQSILFVVSILKGAFFQLKFLFVVCVYFLLFMYKLSKINFLNFGDRSNKILLAFLIKAILFLNLVHFLNSNFFCFVIFVIIFDLIIYYY